MNDATFVILGATGDLSKKKLVPSIYNLLKNNRLDNFAVIGIGRENTDADTLLGCSKEFIKSFDSKVWSKLRKRYYYFNTNFYDLKRFAELGNFVRNIEKTHKLKGNRLFYLATLPQHFSTIAKNLKSCKLSAKRSGAWSKVVFEKPFGNDLDSARMLNRSIKKSFDEKQIYRIDHYLGKELVQNISVLRFTNSVIEPLWNRKYIDHVQIILSESAGIGDRGGYYDKYGALKDVVQNHMMQMLTLAAIEPPNKLTGEFIRGEKVRVLKAVRNISKKDVVLGQYIGYRKEKSVKHDSKTETFAALKLFIDNKRWKGVPFYLITGKCMEQKITSIYIQFKEAPCLLFKGICNFMPNYLVIQIEPEEGFYLQINGKVPGKPDITSIKMDFCHECTFGLNTPEAYENLLSDVLKGDNSVFVRSDEIEMQWKVLDNIIKDRPQVIAYKQGDFPAKARELICQKHSCANYVLKPRESKSVSEHAQKHAPCFSTELFLTNKDKRQWHLKVK